jgi:hypothetical protein
MCLCLIDLCAPRHVERPSYLTRKRQRGLVKPLLLRVADVRGDDPVELQALSLCRGGGLAGVVELHAVLLGLDRELATDGVLDLGKCWIEVLGGETHIGPGM